VKFVATFYSEVIKLSGLKTGVHAPLSPAFELEKVAALDLFNRTSFLVDFGVISWLQFLK
jgi:hypothetical protein